MAPLADATASSVLTVATNNTTGYNLTATDASDTIGMVHANLINTVLDWTGTPAAPTTWAAGVSGFFGLTVLSATGGKDTSRWGIGTTPTDYVNNKYVGLRSTTTTLYNRNTYSAPADTITTSYRINVVSAQLSGIYSTSITYTATANP
ncbi:MAG: hypothetical protein H7123_05935 [Thermoleophilia bacterium]|nr:hypothetical protein [Thermoleophilia bacterium]